MPLVSKEGTFSLENLKSIFKNLSTSLEHDGLTITQINFQRSTVKVLQPKLDNVLKRS